MIGNRIKEARKARNMSRPQLSTATGIPYPTLAGIENGDQDSTTQLDVIANALGARVEWLRTGRGAMDAPSKPQDSEDWPDIRAYRQAAALGDGAVPDEYAETHALKFRAQSLQRKRLNPDRMGIVYGRGESMLPRIKTGDAIMFDTGDTEPRDGYLYVVSYGGNLLAKQLSLLGGRWFIESLNKDDPKWRKPEPIDEHKGFKIHGRVRWIGSWED